MPLKVSVGVQKKVGQPDYGSLGASCHVEFEADSHLLQHDLAAFQQEVRGAYVACQQAVHDQLAQAQAGGSANGASTRNGSGNGSAARSSNGNGHTNGSNGHNNGTRRLATASQARAIKAIASRQKLDLASLLHQRFGVQQPEDLSIGDASTLIDEIKPDNGNGGGRR